MNLRMKMLVQEKQENYDQFGINNNETWQDKFEIFCSLERLSNGEVFLWGRRKIIATNKIITRYNININNSHRFDYKNRKFEILNTEHDEMNKSFSIFIVRELINT